MAKETASTTSVLDAVAATAKRSAKAAAVRVATRQFVLAVRTPIVALLNKQAKTDESAMKAVAAFMDTSLGIAALSGFLAVILPHVPIPAGEAYATKRNALIEELTVAAMEGAGNVAAELVTGPLRDLVVGMLSGNGDLAAGVMGLPSPLADTLGAAAFSDEPSRSVPGPPPFPFEKREEP